MITLIIIVVITTTTIIITNTMIITTITIMIRTKAAFQSIGVESSRGAGVGKGCTRGGHGDLLHLCNEENEDGDEDGYDHDHTDGDHRNHEVDSGV